MLQDRGPGPAGQRPDLEPVLQRQAAQRGADRAAEPQPAEEGAVVTDGQTGSARAAVHIDLVVEGADVAEVRDGLGPRRRLRDAQIDAEARADVLAAGGAPGAGRLVEQEYPAGAFDPEVEVGPGHEFDVDHWRERRPGELGRGVPDLELAAGAGDRGAERVVLQPVPVEREDRDPVDHFLGLADGHLAADDPQAQPAEQRTGQPRQHRVVERRDIVAGLGVRGAHGAPGGLQGGQRHLGRARRHVAAHRAAVQVDVHGIAAVGGRELHRVRAVGADDRLAEQFPVSRLKRGPILGVGVVKEAERVARVRGGPGGDALVRQRGVHAHRRALKRNGTVLTDRCTQHAPKGERHDRFPRIFLAGSGALTVMVT